MRIAGDQLHAAESAGDQAAQERVPEGAVFAGSYVESEHFTLAKLSTTDTYDPLPAPALLEEVA